MSDVTESVNMFAVNISNAELDFLRSNSRVVISRMYGKHTTVGDLAGELLQSRKRIAMLESQLAAANEDAEREHDMLENARLFIKNGIAIGCIQLPDKDLDDPASKTYDLIMGVMAKHESRIQEAQNG
jgi:hypothetical protein